MGRIKVLNVQNIDNALVNILMKFYRFKVAAKFSISGELLDIETFDDIDEDTLEELRYKILKQKNYFIDLCQDSQI